MVAEEINENPDRSICYKTFHGIQEYKKKLGFPYMTPMALERIDQPMPPIDPNEPDPLINPNAPPPPRWIPTKARDKKSF